MKRLLLIPWLIGASAAGAHSASDAYLTLTAEQGGANRRLILHGQWDIALRDLDFVLALDDDGDGRVTWGEVRRHQADIARYAYARLRFDAATGAPCKVTPVRQLIDTHADGAYAVLTFDVACDRPSRTLSMDYSLFFAIDPSHRGIFVMHTGGDIATALLSPQNAQVDLAMGPAR